MPSLAHLLLSALSTVGARLASAAATFFVFALIVRRWDPPAVGEFAAVYACFGLLQQLPLLGLNIPFAREVARRPAALEDVGPSVATIGLCGAAGLGLLLGLVGELVYPAAMRPALWLVGATLLPGGLVTLAESVLIARGQVDRVAAIAAGESLIRALVWTALVWHGAGLTDLFLALAIIRTTVLVPFWLQTALRPMLRPARVRGRTVRDLLRTSATFAGILLLAAGISRLDVLMLSLLVPLEHVALYSAPYKIYEAMVMPPSALALSFFSAAVRARGSGSSETIARAVQQIQHLSLVVGLPAAMVVAVMAPTIVTTLFGPRFLEAALVLTVLSIVPVLGAVEQTLGQLLLVNGLERLDLRVLAIGCSCYALLLALMIPSMGYRGAALATTVTAVVQLIVRYRTVRAHLPLPGLLIEMQSSLFASVLMGVTIVLLRPVSPWVAASAGLALYLAVLAMSGTLSKTMPGTHSSRHIEDVG